MFIIGLFPRKIEVPLNLGWTEGIWRAQWRKNEPFAAMIRQ